MLLWKEWRGHLIFHHALKKKSGDKHHFLYIRNPQFIVMTNSRFSRRNFITTVAAGATTVANFTPLQNFASIISEDQAAFPDRQIKIISTENLSVKRTGKNQSSVEKY